MKPLRGLSMSAMAENAMHRTNGRISNRIILLSGGESAIQWHGKSLPLRRYIPVSPSLARNWLR